MVARHAPFPRAIPLESGQRRRLLRFALAGMATVLLPACRDGASGRVAPGDRFPDIHLPYLDDRKVLFAAKPDVALVVNFWASWCEPCRREMPGLKKLSTFFHPDDLMVIGIAVDSDVNLASEFGLRYSLTFPLLSDRDMALSNGILHIPVFPITYLLKRDRTIASIIVGERDWSAPGMIEEIEKLLGVHHRAAA